MVKDGRVDLETAYNISKRHQYKYTDFMIGCRIGRFDESLQALFSYIDSKITKIAALNDVSRKLTRA